jgi:hypothetical protein
MADVFCLVMLITFLSIIDKIVEISKSIWKRKVLNEISTSWEQSTILNGMLTCSCHISNCNVILFLCFQRLSDMKSKERVISPCFKWHLAMSTVPLAPSIIHTLFRSIQISLSERVCDKMLGIVG